MSPKNWFFHTLKIERYKPKMRGREMFKASLISQFLLLLFTDYEFWQKSVVVNRTCLLASWVVTENFTLYIVSRPPPFKG